MNSIIVLWSHPRSMSTAVERVMRERGDCTCFHEPFMYDYYVHRAVRPMPHFQAESDRPTRYEDIRDMLLHAAAEAPVFAKDMSYYVVPRIFDDPAFAKQLTNAFLIRDPEKSIASYHRLDPEVTEEEIGIEAQWRHFEWLAETTGDRPLVLEAESIQADAEGVIAAFWQRIGLDFVPDAFEWQSEAAPKDWGQVSGWHGDVAASGGIASPRPDAKGRGSFEDAAERSPHLRTYLEHHRPFYERLKGQAMAEAGG